MSICRLREDITAAGISGLWVTADAIDRKLNEIGAYLLLIRLNNPVQTDLPRLGSPRLVPGWYLYAGSARGPGGLAARVGRHFRQDKSLRWHVDRLTVGCAEMAALTIAGGDECDLVRQLLASGRFKAAVTGFGSSDCVTCESHLLTRSGGRQSRDEQQEDPSIGYRRRTITARVRSSKG